jgi:Na+/H+ antiporter NhaC
MMKKVAISVGSVLGTLWVWSGDLGILPIWPSVVALFLVFGTRSVVLGLLGGAFVGTFLQVDGAIWRVPMVLIEEHLLPNFSSPWKSGAIIFTLLIGGFVHLLERGGVLQGLLRRVLTGESPRKVETGAAAFGLVCFFDGLANSLMVGRLFRPLSARAGVSRVRLAWIVDTTSAAVACLAFISTWIAYQLAMIREGYALSGRLEEVDAYGLFFASIPHNYYAWFALYLMAYAIFRQWDFGPMGRIGQAESRDAFTEEMSETAVGEWWRAGVPVLVLVGLIFIGIYIDGSAAEGLALWPLTLEKLAKAFSSANVPAILILASAMAAFCAWLFYPRRGLCEAENAGSIFVDGMLQLFRPVLILVMAWVLSSTFGALGTADYLGEALGGRIDPTVFPVTVFLLGALVAFTTGTSWGTMGLLMPLAIPIAFEIQPAMEAAAMMPVIIGAVFSGAVFGDHCSPMSDTTIVSSLACGVAPIDHVQTQLPYALLAAAGAAVAGFPIAARVGGVGSAILSFGIFVILVVFVERISRKNSSKA